MIDFVFKNGYYEVQGTKIQVVKVRDHDLWVVVDTKRNDAAEQCLPMSLEKAKEFAIKMAGRK